jgi:formylglycine-generating enzyme required for sulfatase activity
MMGSPETEGGRRPNEGPRHTVHVAAFAAGKFEVTFAEWEACVRGGGCLSNPTPADEGWGRGSRPVINVSWNDAQEYVSWLSREAGFRYRLLTEAEWEYAARAGTATPFSTGTSIAQSQARFDSRSTAPVGSYSANQFGLHDMHGNVWEWVEDPWHESYRGAPNDGSAWIARGDPSYRVLRGGSWLFDARALRSASRGGGNPAERSDNHGFRVARMLQPTDRAARRLISASSRRSAARSRLRRFSGGGLAKSA